MFSLFEHLFLVILQRIKCMVLFVIDDQNLDTTETVHLVKQDPRFLVFLGIDFILPEDEQSGRVGFSQLVNVTIVDFEIPVSVRIRKSR